MQTGYDSYWMYQNSRPGPLHNLQNNNHYSNAVFTDSNRHVQDGRLFNHFNNCMQPPNNVAYYHQNSQFHNSEFHQMPSSMYTEPFRSSTVNNTQPRRPSVDWSNRSGYLPQDSYTSESFSVRCSENYSKFSQVRSNTNKNNIRINTAPANSNIRQISRIRVKDVYSINNNNVSDSILHNALLQPHSKGQRESVINYGSNNYTTVDFDPQTKFIDNTYLAQPKLPPPYYRSSEQPQQSISEFGSRRPIVVASKSNIASFISEDMHPDKYSLDNMLQNAFANEKASELTNSGHLESEQTFDQITQGMFNTSNNLQNQNCCQNELESTTGLETLSTSQMLTHGTHGISNSSQVLTRPNSGENVSKSLMGFNSPKTPRTNLTSQVTSNPETTSHHPRQEGTLIKISIPHTGQSSFIRLNDTSSTSNGSSLSLPCLLDSNNKLFNAATSDRLSNNRINNDELINSSVLQPTTRENTRNSPSTSVESQKHSGSSIISNSSLPRKVASPEHSFVNDNKESVNNLVSNSVPQTTSKTESTDVSKVLIPEKNIELNLLSIKQEKSLTSAESHREDDNSISGNNEFDRTITKEKIPVEENGDNSTQLSENLSNIGKSSPVHEETSSSDSIEDETFPKNPKDIPLEKPESEPAGNSVPKGQRLKKRVRQHISYKSKINRVKLDMLIQFLKKDDEPVEDSLEEPCEKSTSENIDSKNREKHRIRKLSKTCIVKNKNISREMVSLVSQKTSRVDPSSEICRTVKSNVDSQKGKENSGETGENVKNENSNSSSENEPQKEVLERNIKNELVAEEVQEPGFKCLTGDKEKEMINMMRVLRTLTTNFCTNCKLSSSVDSFWVNVVSFELRCLNCFKKFFPKEFSSKNCGSDTGKQKNNSGDENSLKNVDNSKSVSSNSKEIQQEKSDNLNEENLPAKITEDSSKGRRESFDKLKRRKSLMEVDVTDGRQNSRENVSPGKTKSSFISKSMGVESERKTSLSEESADKISSKKSISKDQLVDNKSRISENECKNEELLRSPLKKMEDKEDVPKKEKKGNVDTPKRKSSTESTPNKTSMSDECAKKEGKRLMDPREKERCVEQPKISKHGKPEMSEISQIPPKSKDMSSINESKSKSGSSDSEKRKILKRKHSNDDDPSPRKVHVPNDQSCERKEVVTPSSDKTKSNTSKDMNQKSKPECENQISKTDKPITKDVTPEKIKTPDQKTRTEDSIKSLRKRRAETKQNEDKKQGRKGKQFVGKIPKHSSSVKDNEKQLESVKTIKKEQQSERNG